MSRTTPSARGPQSAGRLSAQISNVRALAEIAKNRTGRFAPAYDRICQSAPSRVSYDAVGVGRRLLQALHISVGAAAESEKVFGIDVAASCRPSMSCTSNAERAGLHIFCKRGTDIGQKINRIAVTSRSRSSSATAVSGRSISPLGIRPAKVVASEPA